MSAIAEFASWLRSAAVGGPETWGLKEAAVFLRIHPHTLAERARATSQKTIQQTARPQRESDLIIDIGRLALREACLAMVEWRRTDPERAPKYIGVNVSRAELALGSVFLELTRATLSSVKLPSDCLQLEVTEREVMRNPEACLELTRELRSLGIRLAMDDFGTGTSSLGLLRELPLDTIKIDRSFVKDLIPSRDVLAVTHATTALIANLRMISLAERVEEPAQVAVLQSLGCRYGQGYLFSRPVRADRLLGALESNRERELAA
jgi:EAL domain-containing protein (putative c-di-GMP-specific phosphodiesterase class I)